ncbi:MAG: cytochrome C [Rhodocyclaceae bacterium]|jgi:sulfide dehydrogenase cytochrome subunit|nr:cytochrome C [Rhodocyclaceae bacterium]
MKYRKIALAVSLLGLAGAASADNHALSRNMASACASCHGTNGHSIGGLYPLAGMPKDEMIRKVKDFRSGATPATVMHQLSKGYTDQQIEMIANFYAAQK